MLPARIGPVRERASWANLDRRHNYDWFLINQRWWRSNTTVMKNALQNNREDLGVRRAMICWHRHNRVVIKSLIIKQTRVETRLPPPTSPLTMDAYWPIHAIAWRDETASYRQLAVGDSSKNWMTSTLSSRWSWRMCTTRAFRFGKK